MRARHTSTTGTALLALVAMVWGCSDSSEPTGEAVCDARHTLDGACVGAPASALCTGETCSLDGCPDSAVARTDAELTAALEGASSGTCVALAPGAYTSAAVPAGVSLHGRGAGDVTVGSVELSGAGSRLVGLSVGEGGIVVDGSGVEIRAVRVAGASGDGIHVAAGASVAIEDTEVVGGAEGRGYGIVGRDAAAVQLRSTLVAGARGPGIWLECSGGCDCATTLDASFERVVVDGAMRVGVSLVGVKGSARDLVVRATTVDGFEPGGGVSVSGCSELTASGLVSEDNTSFGVLVDGATVAIDGAAIHRNLRGVWLQNLVEGQTARVENATVLDNQGVGLGMSAALGVTVADSDIADTGLKTLPVWADGDFDSADVGDGVSWSRGSQVVLSRLGVSGSGRASILIDGAVAEGSTITDVRLAGGDDALGIVQQSLASGGLSPAVEGAPSVDAREGGSYAVPAPVTIPPSI